MAIIQRTKDGKKFGPLIVRYTDYDPRSGEAIPRQVATGSRDRAIAKQIEARCKAQAQEHKAEAAQVAELRRRGLSDPKTEQLADHAQRPLTDHLADYETMTQAHGRTARHIRGTVRYCRQAFDACGFTVPDDLDAVKVAQYVEELKQHRPAHERTTRKWKARAKAAKNRQPLGARAINARLTALKGFSAWLFRTERLRTDPLKQVVKLNAKTDPRHRRRALTDDELAKLIEAADSGGAVLEMAGPDRAMLYRVAVGTGLRASELASLTPESFDLDDIDAASVTVEAAYSKHRDRDVQPIGTDLAAMLATYIADKPQGQSVWRMPAKPAHMMRTDLEAAQIPYRDRSDRVADFHALRHTFITRLARTGAWPATCMKLARHRSIAMTMEYYTHVLVADERTALSKLPPIETPAERPKRKATGTDDARP